MGNNLKTLDKMTEMINNYKKIRLEHLFISINYLCISLKIRLLMFIHRENFPTKQIIKKRIKITNINNYLKYPGKINFNRNRLTIGYRTQTKDEFNAQMKNAFDSVKKITKEIYKEKKHSYRMRYTFFFFRFRRNRKFVNIFNILINVPLIIALLLGANVYVIIILIFLSFLFLSWLVSHM